MTNILSFAEVENCDNYVTVYDNKTKDFIMTNKTNGNMTVFGCTHGLHTTLLDADQAITGVAMLHSVAANKKLFSKRQVECAEVMRELYETIGFPSLKDFKHIVSTNMTKDNPVLVEDIKVMEKIYGPNEYVLKGKTT